MEKSESTVRTEAIIKGLFQDQKLAVLSTQNSGQPYASLVAFVASDDLKHLYFATARNTRKYRNLATDPKVALLMDSRSNQESDIHTAVAVTATGSAGEVTAQDKNEAVALYLSKHPNLRDFILAETTALIRVTVESHYLVTQFQQVLELRMSS